MVLGPLTLVELKIEARNRNYCFVRREGEIAQYRLNIWKGHPTSGSVHYLLMENEVLVTTGLGENAARYVLCLNGNP